MNRIQHWATLSIEPLHDSSPVHKWKRPPSRAAFYVHVSYPFAGQATATPSRRMLATRRAVASQGLDVAGVGHLPIVSNERADLRGDSGNRSRGQITWLMAS
jgi:hypothetical protein